MKNKNKIEYEIDRIGQIDFEDFKTEIEKEDKINQSKKKEIREIPIDIKKSQRQKKIILKGIEVYFPYEPYENQKIYMEKVIEACEKGSIAGLESPTGTGKTLCLLCSSLAWLKYKRNDMIKNKKKYENIPKIYYTSRTHSQLSSIIKELKKTCYLPRNSVLSSRDYMCVNNVIKGYKGKMLNNKCTEIRLKKNCKYFYGAEKILTSAYDNCDIEELFNIGYKNSFCPYFFERYKKESSDIIFLPYNYIFEPSIKGKLKINLDNSILIIDEAHNIQEICENAVSCSLNTKILEEIYKDLNVFKNLIEGTNFLPKNSEMKNINIKQIDDEMKIIDSIKNYLKSIKIKTGKWWPDIGLKLTTKEMFDIFFEGSKGKNKIQKTISPINENNGLTTSNLNEHINFLNKIETFINEEVQKGTLLSNYISVLTLIDTLSKNYIEFIESGDQNPLNNYSNNYKFFINDIENSSYGQKKITKDRTLFLFCFNPGFGFKLITNEGIKSIIITSGTLSPINGIESELKCSFDIQLENTHVIDMNQVNFSILTNSTRNSKVQFLFNNQNKNNIEMIQQLGYSISDLCKITPGGILVFFTSFSFLNMCINIWTDKRIISEIEQYKEIFKDMHDQYKNKLILKNFIESNQNKNSKGAIFFSVCRGTSSEGINFNDDYARMVIVVGIPYANLGDIKVQLKKEYLDEFNRNYFKFIPDKKVTKLTGSDWYNQSASRTVNQALGRVIRHVNDYGSMILIDIRYKDMIYKGLISKWIRNVCRFYSDDNIINVVKNFFEGMKNFKPKILNKKINALLNYDKEYDDYVDKCIINQQDLNGKMSILGNGFISAKKLCDDSSDKKRPNDDRNFVIKNDIHFSKGKIINNKENITHRNNEKKEIVNKINLRNSLVVCKNINQKDNIENNILFSQEDLNQFLNDNESLFNDESSKKNDYKNKENKSNNVNKIKILNDSEFEIKMKDTPKTVNKKIKEDIPTDKIFEKLLKMKQNSQLEEFLGKYNLKLDFDEHVENNNLNENNEEGKLKCPICFEIQKDNNEIHFSVSRCGHIICNNCWEKCLNNKLECPICKKKVTKKTLVQLFLN